MTSDVVRQPPPATQPVAVCSGFNGPPSAPLIAYVPLPCIVKPPPPPA